MTQTLLFACILSLGLGAKLPGDVGHDADHGHHREHEDLSSDLFHRKVSPEGYGNFINSQSQSKNEVNVPFVQGLAAQEISGGQRGISFQSQEKRFHTYNLGGSLGFMPTSDSSSLSEAIDKEVSPGTSVESLSSSRGSIESKIIPDGSFEKLSKNWKVDKDILTDGSAGSFSPDQSPSSFPHDASSGSSLLENLSGQFLHDESPDRFILRDETIHLLKGSHGGLSSDLDQTSSRFQSSVSNFGSNSRHESPQGISVDPSFPLGLTEGYLPPFPSNPASVVCETDYVTSTKFVTSSVNVPQTQYNEVLTTATELATTTLVQRRTSLSIMTVFSTVYTTQFTTLTQFLQSTVTRTSQIFQQPQTRFVTSTHTSVSTVYAYNTIDKTSTNLIPTTIFETQVVPTTTFMTRTQFVTKAIIQTVPATTRHETEYQINTNFVVKTVRGETLTNTKTVFSTFVSTFISSVPAQTSVVYSTQLVPIIRTTQLTQFVTKTQTQTLQKTSIVTQLQTLVSTQTLTSTIHNEKVITRTTDEIQTSFVQSYTQIVSTSLSTRFSNIVNTQYLTSTHKSTVTVIVPGVNMPVNITSTVKNPLVSTYYYTNNVINAVTVTRTVQGPCGVTQADYNYNVPSVQLNF